MEFVACVDRVRMKKADPKIGLDSEVSYFTQADSLAVVLAALRSFAA